MNYDIVIAGGGTAGCACAYIASKLGLKTLLIEKNSFLGGTMTSALVTPAMKTSSPSINTEFFTTIMSELRLMNAQITYPDGNIGWFNPELMKIALDKLLIKSGVHIIFNSTIDGIEKTDNTITKISIAGNNLHNLENNIVSIHTNNKTSTPDTLSEYIDTKYLVDATGDAQIFQKLNCDFLEKKYLQPANLRFIMSGINLEEFSDWILDLDKDRNVTTSYIVNGEIHLSTAYTWDTDKNWALRPIFQKGIDSGEITEAESNYFQLFTIPGMQSSLAFNCPRILSENGIDPCDKKACTDALITGRTSILRLSTFLKHNFKGFEKAYVSSIANSLGIRISNSIKGKYVYTIDDLKSGKKFDNPCLISDYPIDIHSTKKNASRLEIPKRSYMLPMESLMSVNYNNLFAIGRCISADYEAQGALRIIPSCFSMGEGLAKYLAELENKISR